MMASMKYPHLLPNTAAMADESDSARVTYLDAQRWIPYDRADAILAHMEDMFNHPRTVRMPSLLITGDSNNGKSSLVDHFVQRHPAEENPNGPNIFCRVLRVECVPRPTEGAFYDSILSALSKRTRPNQLPVDKLRDVVDLLAQIETKILIVDEINNILACTLGTQRTFLNALKYLSNVCRLSIVATGTHEAARVVTTDPQIGSRLVPMQLPVWQFDRTYRELLASFEQLLPLKEPSLLSSKALALQIHSRTDGTIGSTAELLNSASKWAIKKKLEKIDEKAVASCDYRSPGQRRQQSA